MQTEYIYPSLGDRTSPKEWVELGKPNLVQKAIERKENILNNATKKIDPIIDKKLRSEFNIHLA
jgi:trimethylamine--corrinoid protein Co-methyltransferase